MASIWHSDPAGIWNAALIPDDSRYVSIDGLTGGHAPRITARKRINSARPENSASARLFLVRTGTRPRESWFVLTCSHIQLRLNGREVSTSMAALRDRDVISSAAKASEWIFTTERLPQVTHFEGSEGGYCFRCKRPVVTGQDVVICPNCLAPYHQLETQPCWTYASFCANCNRSTELANTRYAWTPDEL